MQVKTTYSLTILIALVAVSFATIDAAQMSNEDRDLQLALAKSVLTHLNEQARAQASDSQLERVLAESKKEAELKEAHRKEMEELNFQIACAQSEEDEQWRKYKEAVTNNKRVQTMPAAHKKDEAPAECPICLEPCTKPFRLSCKHLFCRECIGKHLVDAIQYNKNAYCPLCRTVINETTRKNATI